MSAPPPGSVAAELDELIQTLGEIQQVNYWQGEPRSRSHSC